MTIKQTPLSLEGVTENIYAGFWIRLGALLLDFLIVLPVSLLTLYINGLSKNAYFFTVFPSFIFGLWYYIYLVKKYGGTPGKLIVGITIIKIDGENIDWKEAILRHIVLFGISIFGIVLTIVTLMHSNTLHYESLGWMQKQQYLMALSPILFSFYTWTTNIWIYSEYIVLLTNKRKRAIHDYIAGTVIVKKEFVKRLKESISNQE